MVEADVTVAEADVQSRLALDRAGPWSSWHLHCESEARTMRDRILAEVIGPVVATRPGKRWFFLRYWQGGPHLRLRMAGLSRPQQVSLEHELSWRLADAARPRPGEQRLGREEYGRQARRLAAGEVGRDRTVQGLLPTCVRRQEYEPETDRYGGLATMAENERLFQVSSELVLAMVGSAPQPALRSAMALAATMSAVAALGDAGEQAYFYARGVQAWRSWAQSYGLSAEQVDRLCHVEAGDNGAGTAARRREQSAREGALGAWSAAVAVLIEVVGTPEVPAGLVLSSHVHMLHNRLGLGTAEELRTYAWLSHRFPVDPTSSAQRAATEQG